MNRPRYSTIGFRAFLATSFLGAFNDNFFKLIVTCFALSRLDKTAQNTYIPLTGAMFVLPYLLCSSYAGFLSDRFAKRKVLIWSKWLELAVMLFGLALFAADAVYALLFALFLMGAQSALYSPAKYGFLPETLTEGELPKGNGMTQLCTFLAIIAGSWAGGIISRFHSSHWTLGALYCVLAAALGVVTVHFASRTPEGRRDARFSLNPVGGHLETFRIIMRKPPLFLMMAGNSFFWFVAALFQNNLSLYVKQEMMAGEQTLGALLGAVGLGIGLGCMACGLLSFHRIEYGLILPGGVMTALASILMVTGVHSLFWAVVFTAMLGFFAGIYQLPLATAVQRFSPPGHRGSCLALGNAMDCIGMLLAYVMQWILLNVFGLRPSGVFVALGVITLAVMVFMAFKEPTIAKRSRFLLTRSR